MCLYEWQLERIKTTSNVLKISFLGEYQFT